MKFLDYSGLDHLIAELKVRFVQEQAGKGLSANDFTNILKQKLDGIASNAQVNAVDKVNGKIGEVVITSDDINFLSSVSGATVTTVRAIIDDIIAKNNLQDNEINKKVNNVDLHAVAKSGKYTDLTGAPSIPNISGKADTSYVDGKLAEKVDKAVGKVLTTNDFTTVLKNKLDGVEANSQANKIELIKRNGTNLAITNKAIDIIVPTKLSDLTNDRTYKTEAEIRTLIQEVGRLKKEIVTTLPAVGSADENTMYLIASGSGYAEYLLIGGKFEKLGDTSDIDLAGYVKTTDITTISNAEINAFLNAQEVLYESFRQSGIRTLN